METLPNSAATVTEPNASGSEPDRGAVDSTGDDRPILESRRRRLGAYLRHNGERICRDALAVGAWALVMTTWAQGLGLPRWLCYLVAFAGVVGYTRVTSSWRRPYGSADDPGARSAVDRPGRSLQEPKQRNE